MDGPGSFGEGALLRFVGNFSTLAYRSSFRYWYTVGMVSSQTRVSSLTLNDSTAESWQGCQPSSTGATDLLALRLGSFDPALDARPDGVQLQFREGGTQLNKRLSHRVDLPRAAINRD